MKYLINTIFRFIISSNINRYPYFLIIIIIILFCGKTKQKDLIPEKDGIVTEFISSDYIFVDNHGLYYPRQVRTCLEKGLIYVLNAGTRSIYVFSLDGKYVRKMGRIGQGPGELVGPVCFEVNNRGEVFVYDHSNNRITSYSINGNYYSSFSVYGRDLSTIAVTDEGYIIMNLPKRGYYLTIFNRKGDIIQEIGLIDHLTKFDTVNYVYSQGNPIVDSEGNFYIFLQNLFKVKKFNNNGDLLFEKELDYLTGRGKKEIEKDRIKPENIKNPLSTPMYILFEDIIYRNNRFYFMTSSMFENNNINKEIKLIIITDNDLNIIEKVKIYSTSTHSLDAINSIDILNENTIIGNNVNEHKIIKIEYN
jgi:hypothetical protein